MLDCIIYRLKIFNDFFYFRQFWLILQSDSETFQEFAFIFEFIDSLIECIIKNETSNILENVTKLTSVFP
jgi:hypothetical protein